jgi:chitin disaccharide deacetylase
MMIRTYIIALLVAFLTLTARPGSAQQPAATAAGDAQPTAEIRLIARADDMGAAQAINEGCIEAYQTGIVRSVEVIVPGPWFLDAVRLLKEHPDLDVGVHLTLTSEWDRVKWRPLTWVNSFVDADGYFHPTTEAFVSNKINYAEVERELKAQIETARRHLGAERITHLSAHMGAATATPQLKAITAKLARQYNLRTDDHVKSAGRFGDRTSATDQRENALVKVLERLQPGDWLVVEHPGYDTPELRGLGHKGYENVASDRSNVRRAFTSKPVAKVVKQRGIKLISYRDL